MCDVQISLQFTGDPVLESCVRILSRELLERTSLIAKVVSSVDHDRLSITLEVSTNLPSESFRIDRDTSQSVRVVGGDSRGVLYGCGRLLRQSRLGFKELIFPDAEPLSSPAKTMRGMYFAIHMHNFYHIAPITIVKRYVEELALTGINTLSLCYHLFHFNGPEDADCRAFTNRMNILFEAARSVGMKTMLLVVVNDGYINSPKNLRYVGEVPRNWGPEICPHKPGALKLLVEQFDVIFKKLANVDYLNLWPYDSGGCLCEKCRPWGGGGLLHAAEPIARVFRRTHPTAQVILSTWMLDYNCGKQGEWDIIYQKIASGELDWVDTIMADGAHVNGYFPQQVVDQRLRKPTISFMDITMRTGVPWGSFGANPMPAFIEQEWLRVNGSIEGGTPYSEGLFEDMNKFIWAQLCWSPKRSVRNIVEEYASYEFCPEYADQIAEITFQIEMVGRRERFNEETNQIVLKEDSRCVAVWRSIEEIDRALPGPRRRSWRWHLLRLRSFIDAELAVSGGKPTIALGRAYDELFKLYCISDDSLWLVRPDEIESQGKNGTLRFVQRGRIISEINNTDIEINEQAIATA